MTLEKVCRYIVITGVFFIPFIPFIVSASMFFPFITGKNFTFRIATEIIFAAWLVLAYLSPAYRPKRSYILWGLTALVSVLAIADAFSPNPLKSFWSNFERMEGWVTLAHLFMYFLAASAVLNTEKLWVRLAGTSVAASVFLGFYGVLQLLGKLAIHQSDTRLDATLGNSAYFAVYMLVHVFITALLFAYARSKKWVWAEWLLGAIMVLQTVTIFYTETRGTILGFLGGVTVVVALMAFLQGGTIRKAALGVLAGLIVLVGGFLLIKDSDFVKSSGPLNRLASISLDSGKVRFMVWNMAWQGVQERPLIGWGQESFNYVFNEHYNPQMYAQEPWFDRAHNVFMDWLIAGGFLGLLAYLSLFFASLYYLWFFRRDGVSPFANAERAILTGLLAGYFFHNIFVFDNLISYMLFASLLAYLHARAVGFHVVSRGSIDHGRENAALRFVAPVVVVVLVGSLYFINIKGVVTAQTLLYALSPQQEGGVERKLTLFKDAYGNGWIGKQEVAEQFLMAAFQIQNSDAAQDVKDRFTQEAIATMEKELERTPNDARLLVFMTSVYNALGQGDKALEFGLRAYENSPTKQYTLFELAGVYLNMNDLENAIRYAKEAYDLAPEYKEGGVYYATVLTLAKRHEEADAILEPFGGAVGVDDNRLLNAYVRAGRNEKVIEMWQARVERSPDDAQTRVSLAAAYLGAGRRAEAVTEIQKAIELNPEFKEQGEYYISEILAGRNP